MRLYPLRAHKTYSNPYGDEFNYADAFESIDLNALKADIETTLKTSQHWWPADWGHYEGNDRATGVLKWTATPVDLISI